MFIRFMLAALRFINALPYLDQNTLPFLLSLLVYLFPNGLILSSDLIQDGCGKPRAYMQNNKTLQK